MNRDPLVGFGARLGCLGLIAAPFFVVGFVVAIAVSKVSLLEALGVGSMAAGIAFVAAFLLLARDSNRQTGQVMGAHALLLAREDVDSERFLASLDPSEHALALRLWHRLGKIYEVPETKFQLDDPLEPIKFGFLIPRIHAFLFAEAYEQLPKGMIVSFPKVRLETVRDLLAEHHALMEIPISGEDA